ncbi:unnamed protein product, partial [Cyprideis torosa]
ACHLLSSALHLAREKINARRLMPSTALKQVVKDLHARFQEAKNAVQEVNKTGILRKPDLQEKLNRMSADKMLYDHAIEMCQSAALDELVGKSESCLERYQMSQIVLHCLSQTARLPRDRDVLLKYKTAVDKRLRILEQQGFFHPYETNLSGESSS